MRDIFPEVIEAGRERSGDYASKTGDLHGKFKVLSPSKVIKRWLTIIASAGLDWQECGLPGPVYEHVSVSGQFWIPQWEDMQWVKEQFWRDDETVVEYHPAKSDYVNVHPFTLHLWKVVGVEFPQPPKECV